MPYVRLLESLTYICGISQNTVVVLELLRYFQFEINQIFNSKYFFQIQIVILSILFNFK